MCSECSNARMLECSMCSLFIIHSSVVCGPLSVVFFSGRSGTIQPTIQPGSPSVSGPYSSFCCKGLNGREGAPPSLFPIRHPLSSSTCGVPGLRPNAPFVCSFVRMLNVLMCSLIIFHSSVGCSPLSVVFLNKELLAIFSR